MARVYATADDYRTYTGQTPPTDVDRQLGEASLLLDTEVLLTTVYDVDTTTGKPTDTEVAAAFARAACAQVQFWGEVGEDVDVSGPVQGVSIGSVQIQYGAGANRVTPTIVGPRVYRALAVLPASKFRSLTTAGGAGGWW